MTARSPCHCCRPGRPASRRQTGRRTRPEGLRWFRDRTSPEALARDHQIGRATAYRYVDEVIDVLAAEAPDLHEALDRARCDGLPHVILGGTIIEPDRCREPVISAKGEVIDLWSRANDLPALYRAAAAGMPTTLKRPFEPTSKRRRPLVPSCARICSFGPTRCC